MREKCWKCDYEGVYIGGIENELVVTYPLYMLVITAPKTFSSSFLFVYLIPHLVTCIVSLFKKNVYEFIIRGKQCLNTSSDATYLYRWHLFVQMNLQLATVPNQWWTIRFQCYKKYVKQRVSPGPKT